MIAQVEQQLPAIQRLCRQHAVLRLDLFGSAAQGTFQPATSDLDFVAVFADPDRPGYARRYLAFAEALEALFGRPVDLLTERMIATPTLRAEIERTHQRIYERTSDQSAA